MARYVLLPDGIVDRARADRALGVASASERSDMYSCILAAVDDSPRSAGIVEAALSMAERFDGQVHLFRSVLVPPAFPAAAVTHPDELPKHLAIKARQGLEQLAAGRPRIVIEAPDLETPHPWQAILAAARRIGADLIVIGSHGYGGWDRILGTNTAKVADRADRNVLVVHEGSTGRDSP